MKTLVYLIVCGTIKGMGHIYHMRPDKKKHIFKVPDSQPNERAFLAPSLSLHLAKIEQSSIGQAFHLPRTPQRMGFAVYND